MFVYGLWSMRFASFRDVNILKDCFVHHPWSRNHTTKGDMKNPHILFRWPRRTWNSASKKLKSFTFGCNDNGILWKWQWTCCNEAKGPRKCFALRKPHDSTANLGFKLFLENLGRNTRDSFLHRLHVNTYISETVALANYSHLFVAINLASWLQKEHKRLKRLPFVDDQHLRVSNLENISKFQDGKASCYFEVSLNGKPQVCKWLEN